MQTTTRIIMIFLTGFVSSIRAEDDPYRLPPNYIVNHYNIDLTVPAETFTAASNNYSGSVEIQFQVSVNTAEVKLHSSYSNIELLTIELNGSPQANYSGNSTTDILTINLSLELRVGQDNNLTIYFNAHLLGGGGFYKESYRDHNNEVQFLATTQFQATNARNAFPCFDEPTYKSTFAFKLTYPSDMNALTNSRSINNITDTTTNLTTTEFDVSPKMSTYLVAFTISKYTCSEGDLQGGLQIDYCSLGTSQYKHRVCSRLDREEARDWATYVTPKVIDHLNLYTGINYTNSLLKLDQVAVPGKSGAMENWGLVIYGETSLLFDNTLQTSSSKQSIAAIISHELAHQWFGNLVTCKWWSETFLNEGFATLFQYYTTDYIISEFEMEKQFVVKILQPILTTDGNLNVPALRSNASTQSQVSNKFGSYTYNKGGSVLRMIEHIVGRDNFKAGVQKYLLDNAYQPVEPQDLWDAIENVTDNAIPNFPGSATLTEIVNNWINKGGYPVLNVSLVGTNIIISQQRFLYSGTDNENSTWYVPVSYSTADIGDNNEITTPRGWVTPTNDFVIADFSNASAWIVVNNQQTGFYRVNYDETLWTNLATALKQSNFSGIHVLNRAEIVEDSHMLARAGFLSFAEVLKIVEFLANDTEYYTWYPAVSLFRYLLGKTSSTSLLGASLTSHFLELIAAATDSVPLSTVNENDHIFTLNQVLVNDYACKLGTEKCVSAARTLFSTYKNSYVRPNINTRSIVYCNALRYSSNPTEDWNFLYEQYQNESVSSDASTIWAALGCSTNTIVLNSFLSKILNNDSVVSSAQYTTLFSSVYNGNEIGVDTALEYFISNYQALIDVFSASGLNAGNVLIGLGPVFTKASQIEKLENFVNSTNGLSSSILQAANFALTQARQNQEIINRHKSGLYAYFEISDEEEEISSTTQTTTTTGGNTDSATTLSQTGLIGLVLVALINSVYAC